MNKIQNSMKKKYSFDRYQIYEPRRTISFNLMKNTPRITYF